MSEAKHTPGPWKYDKWQVYAPHDERLGYVALMATNNAGRTAEAEANGRLIASAPDLAARVEHLEAVNAKLLAALEAVEWNGRKFVTEMDSSYWVSCCPSCRFAVNDDGAHTPNCQLAAAIREGRAADADK